MQTLKKFLKERASIEESRFFANSLYRTTDHVSTALRGASLVERSLTDALLARMWTNGGDAEDELTGNDGPLGTFSRKIRLGEAMRVYGPQTRCNLDWIRTVRNAFAHTHRALDFNYPPIIDICNNLTLTVWPYRPRRPVIKDSRDRYAVCCAGLFMVLSAYAKQTSTGEPDYATLPVRQWWSEKFPKPLP